MSSRISLRNENDVKKGGVWEGRIQFINDVTKPDEVFNLNEMRKLVDESEMITQKWKYLSKLTNIPLINLIYFHKFLLLQTRN